MSKEKPIYVSLNGRDCEVIYRCPVCDKIISSWNIDRKEPKCPNCKIEFDMGERIIWQKELKSKL